VDVHLLNPTHRLAEWFTANRIQSSSIGSSLSLHDRASFTTRTTHGEEINVSCPFPEEVTFELFYQAFNIKFTKVTFIEATDRYHPSSVSMSPMSTNNYWMQHPHTIDILWLSKAIFISTHLLVLHQVPSSYLIELISRDSSHIMSIQSYTIETENPASAILQAIDTACFLLNFFSIIPPNSEPSSTLLKINFVDVEKGRATFLSNRW
jgi:hypothetical protein